MARPSAYTKAKGRKICDLIANGWTLRHVCKEPGIPDRSTILRWLSRKGKEFDEFRGQYAQAREDQADLWADECIDIADDGRNDWTIREIAGGIAGAMIDHEHIQRSRLRVDTRKFLMAVAKPKKYGAKPADEKPADESKVETVTYDVQPKPNK